MFSFHVSLIILKIMYFLFSFLRDRNLYKLGLKGFYIQAEDDSIGKTCMMDIVFNCKMAVSVKEFLFFVIVYLEGRKTC